MRNNDNTEFPMRRPVIGLMVFGILVIFMTSFINGSGIPDGRRVSGGGQSAPDALADVPALMARLQKNPQDMEALQELAESFSRAQDWDRAALFWSKVIDVAPGDINALNHRGSALLRAERYNEAVVDFEKILGLNPNAYHAMYYLGVTYKYGLQDKGKARMYFQRALDMSPKDQSFVKALQEEIRTL